MLVTADNCAGVLAGLSTARELVVDLETTGLNCYSGDVMVGVAIKETGNPNSFYFPFRHSHQYLDVFQKMLLTSVYKGPTDTPNLTEPARLDLVKLLSQQRKYIGFNYGFDCKFLAMEGVPLQPDIEDIQVWAHLMNENDRVALKPLADKYLSKGTKESSKQKRALEDVCAYMGFAINEMGRLPPEIVGDYACKDVILTEQLRDFYRQPMVTWDLTNIANQTCEYLAAVTQMEHNGLKLDVPLIEQYSAESVIEANKALIDLQLVAGRDFNPASPKQVCKWLGIESSAFEVLEGLMAGNSNIQKLVNYRSWQKVKNTYYDKFMSNMDRNYRLHPNINITGTYTGRASSSNPNMQSVPVRDDIYKVKDVFVADEGYELVEADYSQAEVRWATYYAQESTMAEKLLRNGDIHGETSTEIGIPRDAAKRLNFSVIYGIGAETLSHNLKISEKEAKVYLDKYHGRYPGFRRLYKACERTAEDRGWIRLYNGRYRHFNTPNAETQKASSNLIQGSVGAMVQDAIMNLHKAGHKMHLQVHDSIVFSVKKERLHKDIEEIINIMETDRWSHKEKPKFKIPMKVDVKHGERWGNMQKYKRAS